MSKVYMFIKCVYTLFFYKHKGYKHIEAENCPKNKHILSMCLGWEKFLSLVIGMVICKIETNEFKCYKMGLIFKLQKQRKYVERLICKLQQLKKEL